MVSKAQAHAGEQQPLLQKVAPSSMGSACFVVVVSALVCCWCLLDSWQHQMTSTLFGVSEVKNAGIDSTGEIVGDVSQAFTYPLTLAFFQFAFMGVIFLTLWCMLSQQHEADVAGVKKNLLAPQWAGLVTTHIFSTFWLQSLIMPAQMFSPLAFAASRALPVPAAAGFRASTFGARFGGHPAATTMLMSAAAALAIYSQSEIAQCLCIWSGHGIELAGIALIVIYLLVLILPAANVVCMESVMVHLDTNPLLMLATMNILACLVGAPILGLAHFAGWEDVQMAFAVTMAKSELYMLVVWLGIQMVVFSAVTVALIAMVDSFWAVALATSFKAVFWWVGHYMHMYMSCPFTNVSVNDPHASLWALIMLLGCLLVGIAAKVDASATKESVSDAKAMNEWKSEA